MNVSAGPLLTGCRVDIQAPGDQAMIQKYGMKLNDTVLAEPHQMGLYDDLLNNHNAKLIAGGGAQNTARGAQYMLPADSVWYIGCVGQDEYADVLRKACKEAGKYSSAKMTNVNR